MKETEQEGLPEEVTLRGQKREAYGHAGPEEQHGARVAGSGVRRAGSGGQWPGDIGKGWDHGASVVGSLWAVWSPSE